MIQSHRATAYIAVKDQWQRRLAKMRPELSEISKPRTSEVGLSNADELDRLGIKR